MRSSSLALGAALALSASAATAQDATDFRLPVPRAEPTTASPQGPVAPDVPESRRVRAAPTPTPSATRPPAPTPTAAIVVPPVVAETPPPGAQRSPEARAVAAPLARPALAPTAAASAPATAAPPTAVPSAEASPGFALPPAPTTAVPAAGSTEAAESGFPWLWAAGGALLVLLGGAAAWALRRRPVSPRAAAAPVVERPRVAPEPPLPEAATATAEPAGRAPDPAPAPPEPLQLALEPLRLSLTLMNATLAYRLEVANHGPAALTDLKIEADMISAHASLGREEQLAGPGRGGPARHAIDRLAPGETRLIEGEFRLPFPQIVPIRQGDAALLLPLARFRATADRAAPVVRTFVVGQPSSGAGLQPFRLDQGPRIYPELVQRAFA